MHNGAIPDNMVIDHINGIKNDDRLENLRCVTQRENCHNRRDQINRDTPIGVKKEGRGFSSRIYIDGKEYRIGTFDTPKEASDAYMEQFNKINL